MKKGEVWKSSTLAEKYLTGVRGAIPMAKEQLQIMLRIVRAANVTSGPFLDIGCGDGILAATILEQFPKMKGVCLDFSEPMIEAAKRKLVLNLQNLEFINFDYGDHRWFKKVENHEPFELIISGFSIHHQPDKRKRELYREIYELLAPGGLFLNTEHVSSTTEWVKSIVDTYFVDELYKLHLAQDSSHTREQIEKEYYTRTDKDANILAPVETQCNWLRDIEYQDVDCYFKVFEFAIFGGRKPLKGIS